MTAKRAGVFCPLLHSAPGGVSLGPVWLRPPLWRLTQTPMSHQHRQDADRAAFEDERDKLCVGSQYVISGTWVNARLWVDNVLLPPGQDTTPGQVASSFGLVLASAMWL